MLSSLCNVSTLPHTRSDFLQTYEGDFNFNNITGEGKYTWPDGRQYVGSVVNGILEGAGEYTYSQVACISTDLPFLLHVLCHSMTGFLSALPHLFVCVCDSTHSFRMICVVFL